MIKLIIAFLLLATPVWGGTITINLGGTPVVINTTTKQDSLMQDFIADFNQEYDPDEDGLNCINDPDDICLTSETYIQSNLVNTILRPTLRRYTERTAKQACVLYEDLNPVEKQTITNLLDGKSPCRENNP